MQLCYQTFYHSNRELLVCYSVHCLNNGPFDEQTILDHLNTELVRYSDSNSSVTIAHICQLELNNKSFKTPCKSIIQWCSTKSDSFNQGTCVWMQFLQSSQRVERVRVTEVNFIKDKPQK